VTVRETTRTVPYGSNSVSRGASVAARTGADSDSVIGCVMAHELGHLLLGPGHVPDAIMRASWGTGDLEAIRRRRLVFNRAQNTVIRRELQG